MPSTIGKTAQLVKQPARLATGVHQPLTPAMRGHSNPGERSNNGVGSRGLDNSGAMNGESGDRAGRRWSRFDADVAVGLFVSRRRYAVGGKLAWPCDGASKLRDVPYWART